MRTDLKAYDELRLHNRGKLTLMLFCSQNCKVKMRTKTKIHFGLICPTDFPLAEKSCKQLAKILLLNPRVSIRKAKEIFSNKEFWRKVSLLSNKLHCEISGISNLESETNEKDFQQHFLSFLLDFHYELFQVVYPNQNIAFKSFNQKLFSWITEFSFPLPLEIWSWIIYIPFGFYNKVCLIVSAINKVKFPDIINVNMDNLINY